MNLTRRKFLLGLSASGLTVAASGRVHSSPPLSQPLSKALDHIDRLYRAGSPLTGIPTGFTDLDDLTGGLQAGDLVVIAGRPSMGRTAFASNIIENAAINHRIPVAVFSLDMPGSQFAMGMLASLGRINAHKLRTGQLDDDERANLTSATSQLNQAPVHIENKPISTLMELVTRAKQLKNEQGIGLVVVDPLEPLLSGKNGHGGTNEVHGCGQALKSLAQELNLPVVVTLALPPSVEDRPDHRPVMADLRDHVSVREAADKILFIYRDEVYNEDCRFRGSAEIIIGRQRHGPTGDVLLEHSGEYLRFGDYRHRG